MDALSSKNRVKRARVYRSGSGFEIEDSMLFLLGDDDES
jgi:hypothetical protein